jgi:hypothetical protein
MTTVLTSTGPHLKLRQIIVADTFAEHSPADEPVKIGAPSEAEKAVKSGRRVKKHHHRNFLLELVLRQMNYFEDV